jgi:cellulose synthase/poly-beta-1,6-N-acetylglucosamine synthase-like glycosyltransferase
VNLTIDLSFISVPVLLVVNVYTILWITLTVAYLLPKKKSAPRRVSVTPFVSCVVPACNEEKVVSDIIRDLDRQDYRWLEIVVVCHNCKDNTYKIAKNIKTVHSLTVLQLNTIEHGKALALQHALLHTKGDLVAFFDTDNRVPNDFVTKSLPYFVEGYSGVQARICTKNPQQNLLTRLQSREYMLYPRISNQGKTCLGLNGTFGGTGMIIKKDALKAVGGYNNRLIEDFDLSLRMTVNNFKIAYVEDCCVFDEKVSSWNGLFRQRSRWLRGYFELWKKYSLKMKIKLFLHPIDFLYYVSPINLVVLLVNYVLVGFGLLGVPFVSVPLWVWLGTTILLNALFSVCLLKDRTKWWGCLFIPWQISLFVLHWVVVFFYSFKIKNWGQSKTEHGT